MHLDNLLFILLVLFALVFRWLASAATKAKKQGDAPEERSRTVTRPTGAGAEDSDAERVRKFLEALGAPPGAAPPPRVEPRTQIPPRPLAPVRPPPEMVARPFPRRSEAKQQKRREQPPPLPVQPYQVESSLPPTRLPTPETSVLKASSPPAEAAPSPAPSDDIINLLRSPAGLRDAIILREIFGPPRSMQPLDLVGSV